MPSRSSVPLDILLNALLAARAAGAPQIGIKHLLAAVAGRAVLQAPPECPETGPLRPVARWELAFSPAASTLLASIGRTSKNTFDMVEDPDSVNLRSALVAAAQQGEN